MRLTAIAVFLSSILLAGPCVRASSHAVPTDDAIARLEMKASRAPLRDQCFLYAKLVSQMTELAGSQISSGESTQASATLIKVQEYTDRIHSGLTLRTKKLRNTEILMQKTSFHLKDILGSASYDDQQMVQDTLKKLDRVQAQLLAAVFKK